MIDAHAHLDDERFDADRDEAVRRAGEAGVELIVNAGTGVEASRRSIELAHKYDRVLATAGVHAHVANEVDDAALAEIEKLAADEVCVAIGEIGLDYELEFQPRDVQLRAFEAQLALAKRLDMPVVVHCRNAFEDTIALLERYRVRGMMHCFSGDAKIAEKCCDLGLMISFAGQLTYKNSEHLRGAARAIPTEHLLVETDCPYLAPQAVRGKRNEPAFVAHTVAFLANLLELDKQDVDRITTQNAHILFGLHVDEPSAITYKIRNSLYVNLTNRCTNRCVFCPRSTSPRVKGHWLGTTEHDEPSAEQVIAEIGDPKRYDEIVFCGFGEPTLRLDVMLAVAKAVKGQGGHTRLNTNGQADLISGGQSAVTMRGLIDAVSVSLNTTDAAQYAELCHSQFGSRAYLSVVEFVRSAKANGIDVTVTALDYPGVDLSAVERMATELGVSFRSRKYKHLG